ncbi:MAG TPA: glutaredoxin family protein [Burkholderiaceae bacterium]|jgi:glutaredoxin
MKFGKPILSLLILLSTTAAHAQMYKWVGPDGKVTYSDAPPPSSIKQVETKSLSGGGPSTTGLPYAVAEAVKNGPVKLYTTAKCAPCDQARTLLNTRGIPFTEKTVSTNDDIEQVRQITGDTQLPVLTVGRNKQKGFEAGAWNSALTYAGYPESNQLPKNYSNGNVESASPSAKPSTDNQASNSNSSAAPQLNTQLPPPAGNAPPGFRF